MNATVRKFEPMNGKLPPAGRFYIDSVGQVKLFFNLQAVERYEVGIRFRSTDLYHILDHDDGAERILLELFEDPGKGQARLTYIPQNRATKVAVTRFIRELNISFQQKVRFPVWATGNQLYLDLISGLLKSA